jgi:hypothetical protein
MPRQDNQSRSGSRLSLSVAVFALLPLNCVHAISSHSPLDLLAYPAYSVKLNPGNPIANSSAQRILAGLSDVDVAGKSESANPDGDATTTPVNEIQRFGQAKSDGSPSSATNETPPKSFLMRSSGNGQAYLCAVPQYAPATHHARDAADLSKGQQSLSKTEKEERRKKAEEDRKLAYERGLALLEPLKGSCLYLTQGWFTCMSWPVLTDGS